MTEIAQKAWKLVAEKLKITPMELDYIIFSIGALICNRFGKNCYCCPITDKCESWERKKVFEGSGVEWYKSGGFSYAKSVKDAYSTLIPKDQFPIYIMNLQIDPYKMDINVHPRKLEVRFSEPQVIYRSVYRAISSALDKHNLVKTIEATDQIPDLVQKEKADFTNIN